MMDGANAQVSNTVIRCCVTNYVMLLGGWGCMPKV